MWRREGIKSSPCSWSPALKRLLDPQRPSQSPPAWGLQNLLGKQYNKWHNVWSCLKCRCFLRREAGACQGATENSQAARHRACSHWEHLAGILQTVAVVTHHSEATEQPGKTTSREGLAFSFQNKMGSGQGCIYQGSYPQPADTQDLFFWVFSENIPRYWN